MMRRSSARSGARLKVKTNLRRETGRRHHPREMEAS